MQSSRLIFSAIAGLAVVSCVSPQTGPSTASLPTAAQPMAADIAYLCQELPAQYVYFNDDKAKGWSQACADAPDQLTATSTSAERLSVLERLLETLYDPHLTLGVNAAASPQLLPSGADIAAEIRGANYVVAGVRPDSPAATHGLQIGDRLLTLDGTPIADAIAHRIGGQPRNSDQAHWALNAVLAGYRDQDRTLSYLRDDQPAAVTLEPYQSGDPPAPISVAHPADDIVHLRINNSLDDNHTVEAVRAALAAAPAPNGVILDLRNTPSGGNTSVAEPILGMFIDTDQPYQRTIYANGETYLAKPEAGPLSLPDTPLIVLVGRWTGSMGEGMAIGFDATGRAQVMGDRMAGLAGGTEPLKLPNTGITVWTPTYDLHHLDGVPRHLWRPEKPEPADFGAGPDRLLAHALAALSSS